MTKKKNDGSLPRVTGTFWVILVLALLASALVAEYVVLPWWSERTAQVSVSALPQQRLVVGETELTVEVADTEAARSQGLSGRPGLAEGTGMLFVFAEPRKPLFWMKEMQFALDVIWISEGEVIAVEQDVPPPTEDDPIVETMVPPTVIDMVLEVPAGWVAEHGVQVGDRVELEG